MNESQNINHVCQCGHGRFDHKIGAFHDACTICLCPNFAIVYESEMSNYICYCDHPLIRHIVDKPHRCNDCQCLFYNRREDVVKKNIENCSHFNLIKIAFNFDNDLFRCSRCKMEASQEWFNKVKKEKKQMDLYTLQDRLTHLEADLAEVRSEIQKEKEKEARRTHDFAVTSVPVMLNDSVIRDDQNTEHSVHTWVAAADKNGFRRRIPIRMMTDSHLKNVYGVFVTTPAHICYSEMKKEMLRRGLL